MTDLELLLEEVDVGWESPTVTHGIGGCLFVAMDRVIEKNGNDHRAARLHDMINALGFANGHTPWLPDLFKWNDAQTDLDAVRARIANAIYYPTIDLGD